MTHITIAIDGPASSGKSTIAKLLANQKGFTYIDTGAMYRAVTLAVLEQQIDLQDESSLKQLLSTTQIEFKRIDGTQTVWLNAQDVSEKIRTVEVTQRVSEVAAEPLVRERLVAMQQQMAMKESVVMDGRDIGTVVLPNATIKFFFVADVAVRAERRYKENMARGLTTQTLEEIKADIQARDLYDSTRKHSPLKQAEDAILVDTSQMTMDEVLVRLNQVIEKHILHEK